MTKPQGPSHGDQSPWARPGGQHPTAHPQPPSESPTRQMPVGARPEDPATSPIAQPPPGQPPNPQQYPAGTPAEPPPSKDLSAPVKTKRRFSPDPLSIILILVIVVLLGVASLIGTELYARHIADSKVTKATECVVQDNVSVSFGVMPPFLWQHATGRYTNISIQTAGNQLKQAKEMKAHLTISDVRLHDTGDSGGTIGALDAALTWPSAGIKQTVQDMIPLLGNLVTDVTTNPNDGTVELTAALGLGGVTVKPQVVNNQLSLKVVSFTGLGSLSLPRESVQPALDIFSSQLTKMYPLGIHADSVQVTSTGVEAHFSTRNATIPSHSQDPCFANL